MCHHWYLYYIPSSKACERMTHVHTKKGIKIIFISLIALIVLGIISSFVYENLIKSMMTGRSMDRFSETMETIETSYDVFHIIALLLMSLVLYGAYFMYKDSSSFNEAHKQKTKIGLVFLGIWIVLSFFYFLLISLRIGNWLVLI